jgi:hypothetical protein
LCDFKRSSHRFNADDFKWNEFIKSYPEVVMNILKKIEDVAQFSNKKMVRRLKIYEMVEKKIKIKNK